MVDRFAARARRHGRSPRVAPPAIASASPTLPISRASASEDTTRARAIQQDNAEKFLDAFRARPGRHRLRAYARPKAPISWSRGNENRTHRVCARSACRWCISSRPAFRRTYERDIILVEVASEGVSGWGEVTAGENPFYNEEWTDSAWLILRDYVGPRVLGRESRPPPKTSIR